MQELWVQSLGREDPLARVPLRGEGSCGGGGAPRDSAESGATEEGLMLLLFSHFSCVRLCVTGWQPARLLCPQLTVRRVGAPLRPGRQLVCPSALSLPLGLALGSPIFPSGCEGKLGVALESLQGLRDLT